MVVAVVERVYLGKGCRRADQVFVVDQRALGRPVVPEV